MSDQPAELTGPDFANGVALTDLADGAMLAGHAAGKPVLVARRGQEIFAISASCTHYGGPLAEGLLVGDTVRCPWHHACFSLRTGQALRAPALKPVARWVVEQRDTKFYVTSEIEADELLVEHSPSAPGDATPDSIVIVGAGAAGNAAAEMLRREGYAGPVTMIGMEDSTPYDRPNLSKDYLAGSAPEEWIPLRSQEFYDAHEIQLVLGRRVTAIDTSAKRITLDDGSTRDFGALLLATGADPTHLPTSQAPGSRVLYLRSLADSRAIVAASAEVHTVVVIGASFIGLEVAAALRARNIAVHVVAPEPRPLERVLGPELGDFIRTVHESHGVVFHLAHTVARIEASSVTLDDGTTLADDLVVMGVGVRPRLELAEQSGLAVDKGVVVNEFFETSAPGIFAAGDIARYPDALTAARIRVEHWVLAERQGQAAARNMIGRREPFHQVPFFWSQHYDQSISYVGHAEKWDTLEIDGEPAKGDCVVRYMMNGQPIAVATVGRDRESLEAERAMEERITRSVGDRS
jgi:NADPH-dependent 2,4-dienoyl-CoA reductase/sulfur reductase-like enzyme/nitrite reductase/ring-hydroxylating ferredoxin subunit